MVCWLWQEPLGNRLACVEHGCSVPLFKGTGFVHCCKFLGLSFSVRVVGCIHPLKHAQLKLQTTSWWSVTILTCPLVTDAKTRNASQKCFHLVTGLVHLLFKMAQVGDDLAANCDLHADRMWRSIIKLGSGQCGVLENNWWPPTQLVVLYPHDAADRSEQLRYCSP